MPNQSLAPIMRCFMLPGYCSPKIGIRTKKHSGLIAAFSKEYIRTKNIEPRLKDCLTEAFRLRQRSDYDAFWTAPEEKALELLDAAKGFVSEIQKRFR